MKTRKSLRAKLSNPNLPKLVRVPPGMQRRLGRGTMLIPAPSEVEEYVLGLRKGTVTTVSQIRRDLAQRHSADVTCPLVTGIFLRIVAEAAEEDAAAGKKRIAPYWRVIKDDGSLNPKFPGGVERQRTRLLSEGHRVASASGKRLPRVLAPG